jgi:hypothetical protein
MSVCSQTPKLSNAKSGKIAGLTVYTEPNPNARIVIRCQRTFSGDQPLLIIDDKIVETSFISKINPDTIESVTAIKPPESSALYGVQGSFGVLVIITKNYKLRKFIIKDFLEGKTIPGTTVKFKSQKDKNDSLVLAANDSGFVLTNKLNPGVDYDMEVSSVGFKSYCSLFKSHFSYHEETVFMERRSTALSEVVVEYPYTTRCCRCRLCCTTIRCYNTMSDTAKQKRSFKVYPNPVNSGASINLELPDNLSVNFVIRVFSLSGAAVFQQKFSGVKTNTINLLLNSRLSASEYIVQLVDENGKSTGQQKIIIQ